MLSQSPAQPAIRHVSESVARKKKRVTDATCLRDMVNIQKQYLARDKKMGDKVTATLNSASRLMQSISSLVDEEKYLEKKEKREEEKLELKRREVEEEEEELELKKKLGISTGGGNSQKSSDCNTQKAGDDTPSVPSPSPASSGNVASV